MDLGTRPTSRTPAKGLASDDRHETMRRPNMKETTAGPPDETAHLCTTCGTQFAETVRPPEHCPICDDERQYVAPEGQTWTTLQQLRTAHANAIKAEESGLFSINPSPHFGIGQRAY